jgi:plasmid stabilization system protein ParE
VPRSYELRVAQGFWREATQAAAYISKDSHQAAAALIGQIDAALASLEQLPLRGAQVPEAKQWKASYRQILVPPYCIIYRIKGQAVEVLRLRHGAQQKATKEPK